MLESAPYGGKMVGEKKYFMKYFYFIKNIGVCYRCTENHFRVIK